MQILLVGCGKMGRVMLDRWLDQQIGWVVVVDPDAARVDSDRVELYGQPTDIPADFAPDVVIWAVKPQMLERVVPLYEHFDRSLLVSIVAGKTLNWLARWHPASAIVRAMPNTPAVIGRGVTVCCANSLVQDHQRSLAHRLFESLGAVAWVEDEAHMDIVTAISGSGPAYVFLLIETLAHIGAQRGLPAELALGLARATVEGSAELAGHDPLVSLADLRRSVTSPGGTTLAALEVLMNPNEGMATLFDRAIAAAINRAREL